MATPGKDNSATVLHPSQHSGIRTRSSEYRPTSRNKRTAYIHPNKKSSVESQVINDSVVTQSISSERADYQQCEDEELEIPLNELKNLCLIELEKLLLANGKSLRDYHSMPFPNSPPSAQYSDILLFNELSYDIDEMW
ncbi:hypothetical protein SESBI_13650 [Sesbania bispinosa]|nr:hypothetical protein SESBI_13650 [Sesbania bispinosa]